MSVEDKIADIRIKDDTLVRLGNETSPEEFLPVITEFRRELVKYHMDAEGLPYVDRIRIQSLVSKKDNYWNYREACITGKARYVLPQINR